MGADLAPATWVALREVLVGFAIAAVAGVGLAIVLHMFAPLRRAVYPLLIGSQTIPIVVLAPILVILLGYGILPKLVIVALICFFPIVVNGLDGLRSVDDDFIRMMRTLDANRWAIFRRIEFPAALPSIFSGMRIAATFAAIGAVFGEWSGASAGFGYVILEATPNLQTARIFAAILILTLSRSRCSGWCRCWSGSSCPGRRRGPRCRGIGSVHWRDGRVDSPREPERERTDQMGDPPAPLHRRSRWRSSPLVGAMRQTRRGLPDGRHRRRLGIAAGRPRTGVARRGARLGAEPRSRGPLLRPGEGLLR